MKDNFNITLRIKIGRQINITSKKNDKNHFDCTEYAHLKPQMLMDMYRF